MQVGQEFRAQEPYAQHPPSRQVPREWETASRLGDFSSKKRWCPLICANKSLVVYLIYQQEAVPEHLSVPTMKNKQTAIQAVPLKKEYPVRKETKPQNPTAMGSCSWKSIPAVAQD